MANSRILRTSRRFGIIATGENFEAMTDRNKIDEHDVSGNDLLNEKIDRFCHWMRNANDEEFTQHYCNVMKLAALHGFSGFDGNCSYAAFVIGKMFFNDPMYIVSSNSIFDRYDEIGVLGHAGIFARGKIWDATGPLGKDQAEGESAMEFYGYPTQKTIDYYTEIGDDDIDIDPSSMWKHIEIQYFSNLDYDPDIFHGDKSIEDLTLAMHAAVMSIDIPEIPIPTSLK